VSLIASRSQTLSVLSNPNLVFPLFSKGSSIPRKEGSTQESQEGRRQEGRPQEGSQEARQEGRHQEGRSQEVILPSSFDNGLATLCLIH